MQTVDPMQPKVRIYHPTLGAHTSQPVSCARNLLRSGWRPADQFAADHLGVEFTEEVELEPAAEAPKWANRSFQDDHSPNDPPRVHDPKWMWVEYARAQGYQGDGDDRTKEQLIEEYGKDH